MPTNSTTTTLHKPIRCIVQRDGLPDRDVTEYVRRIQRAAGVDDDGWPGLVTTEAVEALAQTIPAPPPAAESQPPTLRQGSSGELRAVRPLGELALRYCLLEAERWGNNQVSDARIREYLSGCVRDGQRQHGTWLAETYGHTTDQRWAFCIAAQGFCEDRGGGSEHAGAMPPWRAGVFEAERDAIDGHRPEERWVPANEVWDALNHRLLWSPPPGSLVIYGNRNAPGRGHAERLIAATSDGLRSVGANENQRRWVVDPEPIPWANLARSDGTQVLYLRGFIVPA